MRRMKLEIRKGKLMQKNELFNRVVSILEQARSNVVRSINSNMVIAYWLIGREIIEDIQDGKERAQYGKQVIENLSKLLNEKYGSGFSVPNLRNFRQFYQVYQDRSIRYLSGSELQLRSKQYLAGSELETGFNSNLSWSHYRALMRVSDKKAREFYETEIAECGWNKAQLERQMDGYVRLFEDRFKLHGDNPTIGIILCSDKSEAVAKYSILKEGKQIFASKYLNFLPSEEELKLKIEKERQLIESLKEE